MWGSPASHHCCGHRSSLFHSSHPGSDCRIPPSGSIAAKKIIWQSQALARELIAFGRAL
jgi:hypothetical protein